MSGLVVALVGPDGVGKTTISRRLAGLLEGPVHRLYAGDNPEEAERMLTTSSTGRISTTTTVTTSTPPAAPPSSGCTAGGCGGCSPVRS